MLAATSYPILDLFWTMLMIFIFIVWIFILFQVIVDIFRSHDLHGFAKAVWLIFIIFLPFLGVLLYLIFRGHKMQEHQLQAAQAQQQQVDAYIKQAAGSGSTADELAKLADLKAKGSITDADYEAAKAKILR
ncbi:MAG TPA: SHOCT domain-containing protein [Acidimicrobiales bacterium]|jgi:predicted PurR-regulated permease PerM|nr:SHOCT domain-containing protein [Acidimicrobiales bacterium]